MYSFLVLLPLTLITAALGGFLIFSPQARDYVDYIALLDTGPQRVPLALPIAAHAATYAVACFMLVVTTRTISAPVAPDRSMVLSRLRLALKAIFVAVPSVIIVALATYTTVHRAGVAAGATSPGPPDALFWASVVAGTLLLGVVVSGRPRAPRRFGLALVAIVAGIPIGVMALLLLRAAAGGAQISWLLALMGLAGAIGLITSVAAVVLIERPLELFRSTLRPLSITAVDLLAGLALAGLLALVVLFRWRPVESAAILGILPMLLMVWAVVLLAVAGIFAKRSSPVAIVSIAISGVVVTYGLAGAMPTQELRHSSEVPAALQSKARPLSIRQVRDARRIPRLREAFLEWLQARRPAIEAYRRKGKAYPVFVVAAQGGGTYAAYHAALSLARLHDSCPKLVNHVFAISGVSGGALGATVFAELVRSVYEDRKPYDELDGCSALRGVPRLEEKVKAFFAANFLSPVIGSGLMLDIPRLLAPRIPLGIDRAYALEYALESAWRRIDDAGRKAGSGLEAPFYGRWQPHGPAPALFLAATAVNSGIPVIISQIDWSQNPRLRRWSSGRRDEELAELLLAAQTQNERRQTVPVGNILEFRPDLQLRTSTAVGLSARFPYVTPPANLRRSEEIDPPAGLFENINVLELLDGAFFDNSGSWVAISILEDLERYLEANRRRTRAYKEFSEDVGFHLIRFTDRPAQRHGAPAAEEHFELLTPLIALNTVRTARGAQLRGVDGLERTGESYIYLSDPWFTPSLNWLLSPSTKAGIELRSGGSSGTEAEVCCRVLAPLPRWMRRRGAGRGSYREHLVDAKWEEVMGLNDPEAQRAAGARGQWRVERFVPNNKSAFDTLVRLVREGAERPAPTVATTEQP